MPSNVTWTAAHDTALLTSLVSLLLANRREIYRAPGLADVANNGGSRINQRLLLMLRKVCTDFGERGLVDELVRGQQKTGGRKRKSDESPEGLQREGKKVKSEKGEKKEVVVKSEKKDMGEKSEKSQQSVQSAQSLAEVMEQAEVMVMPKLE